MVELFIINIKDNQLGLQKREKWILVDWGNLKITHVITIECKPGTIEWMKMQGFELKPSNEPGRYAIPFDRIDDFNSKVKSVNVSKKCK